MKRTGTLLLALFLGVCLAPHCGATVYYSDGSAANVQALQNQAQGGDTIVLPEGTFTWSTAVTFTKALKLQGQGSGRIIGNSTSPTAIGVGTKIFQTTRTGLPITVGQTLRIAKMPNPIGSRPARENYMEGTVASYSGTTLTMNITRTGGSGTFTFWFIATQSTTTIINDYNNQGNVWAGLITMNQSLTASTEVSGIRFLANPASTNRSAFLRLHTSSYIVPKTLIHDCWFETDGGGVAAIYSETNQGVVWKCSFDDTFSQAASALTWKWEFGAGDISWSTNSTMGADDLNGATNFYVEDCDFHAYLSATDFDSNSRAVFRHSTLDNSGMCSHGADSGPFGMRHVEIYDNELIFDNFGDCNGSVTLPVCWFFWMRGGTGVITDNILPAISSCSWGNKSNILFSVLNTKRNSGAYCCWVGYPAPHQVGQGYGTGAIFHQYLSQCPPWVGVNMSYYTSNEPVYVWNNTGTASNTVGLNQDQTDECGNGQDVSIYVQAGRDYINGPKPGYVKFTYPHPLASGDPPPPPSPTPPPTATPSPAATPTPTPRPTPTATITPRPTSTPIPTATPRGHRKKR